MLKQLKKSYLLNSTFNYSEKLENGSKESIFIFNLIIIKLLKKSQNRFYNNLTDSYSWKKSSSRNKVYDIKLINSTSIT